MVVCDVCKKNKATRKITYPTMIPVEDVTQNVTQDVTQFRGVDLFRTVNGYYKREDVEHDICQQYWYALAMNRDYVFQLTKEMIYNKVNESERNEKQ